MRTTLSLLLASMFFLLLLFGVGVGLVALTTDFASSPAPAPAPQPEPQPQPAKPAPTKKIDLLVFTQPGCAPCVALKAMLRDPALADVMQRFELVEITPPDKRFKQYHVTATPTIIVISPAGEKRMPSSVSTLGQLAAWLGDAQDVHDAAEALVAATTEGGPIGPGGVQVRCDLPVELRAKNVGGIDGLGLCVFTSIMHAARYQHERLLWDLQKIMRSERGGGWPSKLDTMLAKHAKGVGYVQYEGRDASILELALKTGRMPSVTYNGMDCHYHGPIAHMVNLVYLDSQSACILDNNFIGADQLVWMSREDFTQRWTGGRSGWAVILLAGRPAPVPHN